MEDAAQMYLKEALDYLDEGNSEAAVLATMRALEGIRGPYITAGRSVLARCSRVGFWGRLTLKEEVASGIWSVQENIEGMEHIHASDIIAEGDRWDTQILVPKET